MQRLFSIPTIAAFLFGACNNEVIKHEAAYVVRMETHTSLTGSPAFETHMPGLLEVKLSDLVFEPHFKLPGAGPFEFHSLPAVCINKNNNQ